MRNKPKWSEREQKTSCSCNWSQLTKTHKSSDCQRTVHQIWQSSFKKKKMKGQRLKWKQLDLNLQKDLCEHFWLVVGRWRWSNELWKLWMKKQMIIANWTWKRPKHEDKIAEHIVDFQNAREEDKQNLISFLFFFFK